MPGKSHSQCLALWAGAAGAGRSLWPHTRQRALPSQCYSLYSIPRKAQTKQGLEPAAAVATPAPKATSPAKASPTSPALVLVGLLLRRVVAPSKAPSACSIAAAEAVRVGLVGLRCSVWLCMQRQCQPEPCFAHSLVQEHSHEMSHRLQVQAVRRDTAQQARAVSTAFSWSARTQTESRPLTQNRLAVGDAPKALQHALALLDVVDLVSPVHAAVSARSLGLLVDLLTCRLEAASLLVHAASFQVRLT